jgi:hypothetical protein
VADLSDDVTNILKQYDSKKSDGPAADIQEILKLYPTEGAPTAPANAATGAPAETAPVAPVVAVPHPGDMPGDPAIRAMMTPGSPNYPGLTSQEAADFATGRDQGINNLGITANNALSWVGHHVPYASPLSTYADKNLATLVPQRDAYNAQYGENGPAQLGSLLSTTAATLPLMGAVNPLIARGVGAGVDALGSMAPTLASPIAKGVAFLGGDAGAVRAGVPATATTPTFLASPARPLLNTASNATSGALLGTEAAAINSGQSDQPLVNQMAWGLPAGAAAGALFPTLSYAKNALTGAGGSLDPEMANLAANARDMYGIHLKAPQLGLNPSLSYVNSTLKYVPFSGVGADEAATQGQWQQAINKEMGESGTKIFGTTVNSALKRAGGVMDNIGARTDLDLANDPAALTNLANISHEAAQPISGLNDAQIKQVNAHIDKIQDIAAANGGVIPGPTYLNLIRKGEALDHLQNSDSTVAASFGDKIRNVLDDTLVNSAAPGDAASLQEARYQYKVAKTVQPLTARSDSISGPQPTAGDISPVALRQAVLNPRAFGPNATLRDWGDTPLWDLARIGQRMRDPNNSGTAPREAAQNLLYLMGKVGMGAAAGGAGYASGEILPALGSAAAGLTGGRLLGAGLRSNALANRMIESSRNPLAYQPAPNPLTRSLLSGIAGSQINRPRLAAPAN